jgi:hypothetical protein
VQPAAKLNAVAIRQIRIHNHQRWLALVEHVPTLANVSRLINPIACLLEVPPEQRSQVRVAFNDLNTRSSHGGTWLEVCEFNLNRAMQARL